MQSHGSFYRLIKSKDVLLEAVYTYAIEQFSVPLLGGGPATEPPPSLHGQLGQWWQQLADAALAHPEAFAFWRLYRTNLYPLASELLDLGPFVPFQAYVGPVLTALPAAAALLAALLVAQWLAAVEVVLTNPSCRAQSALRVHVLTQAYAGWWQTTGLPLDTPPIAAECPN